MRRLLAGAGALVVVGVFAGPSPAGATPYIVQTEQLVLQLSQGAETHPSSLLVGLPGPVPQLLPGRRWSTDLPSTEAAYVESELSGAPGVDYVSPVRAIRAAAETELVPNNPCYLSACGPAQVDGGPDAGHPIVVEDPSGGPGATIEHPGGQTDLQAVNAAAAWGVTTGSPNVLVAVLDTGVDPEHPQLIGKVVVGQDVCKDDRPLCASADDENGHGTMVTGLIAAATNDGLGIAGLGWNTQVIDFKVLDDTGNGNTADEATGIYEAVSAGAKVINMSFASLPCTEDPTGCGPNIDEEEAVEYAISHGVVVVAAAGTPSPRRALRANPSTLLPTPVFFRWRRARTGESSTRPTVGTRSLSPSTATQRISPLPGSAFFLPGGTATMRSKAAPRSPPRWLPPRLLSCWLPTPRCRGRR